jgi:hypothetical protein
VSLEAARVGLSSLEPSVLQTVPLRLIKLLMRERFMEVLVERVRALKTCCGASEEDLIGLQSLEPSVWSMMKTVCLVPVRTI